MPVPASSPTVARGTAEFPVRRFTVEEYHRLGQLGILGDDDRVELLEGLIVPKVVRNPIHDATVELVEAAVRAVLPDGWRVRVQSAITTSDSEPEPDLAIVAGPVRQHLTHHPIPREVALVIEVADSSLDRDRAKARLYARAGIPHYWIVNLQDTCIECMSSPLSGRDDSSYFRRTTYTKAQAIPVEIEAHKIAEVPLDQLLP